MAQVQTHCNFTLVSELLSNTSTLFSFALNSVVPVPLFVPHPSISVAGSSSQIPAVLLSAAVALADAELPNPCQMSPRIAGMPNRMPVQLSV